MDKDKNNLLYNFIPPINLPQTQSSKEIVGIINSPNLSKQQKSDLVWEVLSEHR